MECVPWCTWCPRVRKGELPPVRSEVVDRRFDVARIEKAVQPGARSIDDAVLAQMDGAGVFSPLGRDEVGRGAAVPDRSHGARGRRRFTGRMAPWPR